MLTHLEPHALKNGKNDRKTREFLAPRGGGGWSAAGGAAPLLRRGEKAYGNATTNTEPAGPWPEFKGCRPLPPTSGAAASGSVSGVCV